MNAIVRTNVENVEIPKIISSICCGDGTPFWDGYEYASVPSYSIKGLKKPYLLEAVGDSMDPTIRNGECVILDVDAPVNNGDVVAVYIDGELFVKRLRKKMFGVWLESDNPKYPPIKKDKEITEHILGRIRKVIRDVV